MLNICSKFTAIEWILRIHSWYSIEVYHFTHSSYRVTFAESFIKHIAWCSIWRTCVWCSVSVIQPKRWLAFSVWRAKPQCSYAAFDECWCVNIICIWFIICLRFINLVYLNFGLIVSNVLYWSARKNAIFTRCDCGFLQKKHCFHSSVLCLFEINVCTIWYRPIWCV